MKTKIYIDNDTFVAGTTLRDERLPEHNNMAFHACEKPETVLVNRKRLADILQCKLADFVSASQT
ncbi:hypothetical protein, partial [Escherichia coli]